MSCLLEANLNGGFHQWGYPNSWLVYKGKCHLEMDDLGIFAYKTGHFCSVNVGKHSSTMEYLGTMWGPCLAKLVNITPRTMANSCSEFLGFINQFKTGVMVFGSYNIL